MPLILIVFMFVRCRDDDLNLLYDSVTDPSAAVSTTTTSSSSSSVSASASAAAAAAALEDAELQAFDESHLIAASHVVDMQQLETAGGEAALQPPPATTASPTRPPSLWSPQAQQPTVLTTTTSPAPRSLYPAPAARVNT